MQVWQAIRMAGIILEAYKNLWELQHISTYENAREYFGVTLLIKS